MIFGYARAFAHEPDTESQKARIIKAGVLKEKLYIDVKLNRDSIGVELKAVLKALSKGDVLVIDRLACLARTYQGLLRLIKSIDNQGIKLIALQDGIDTRKAGENWLFKASSVFNQFLEELKKENIVFGQQAAKGLVIKGGRKPKITDAEANEIRTLVKKGTPVATVAKQYKVERTTIYRILKSLQQPS